MQTIHTVFIRIYNIDHNRWVKIMYTKRAMTEGNTLYTMVFCVSQSSSVYVLKQNSSYRG